MIEVEITNYRSIGHAKIVIDGFTTLVGKNYLGKSNVLRAINSALTNEQGTSFIKIGESYCEVHIVMQGMDLLWHKEEANNYYIINKETYSKIGRDEPPQIVSDSGFKVVNVGDSSINLNFAEQFNSLFLLDKRDSKGIDLLTSVYGLDRLYDAISLCNKEQNDTNDLLRLREKDLELINRDLEKYKDFDKVKATVGSVKNKKKELDEQDAEVSDLREKSQQILDISEQCKRLRKAQSVELPETATLQKRIGVYQELCGYQSKVLSLVERLRALKPVSEIKAPGGKLRGIQEKIQGHKKLASWFRDFRGLSCEVDKLSPATKVTIPELTFSVDPVIKVRGYIESVETHKKNILSLKKQIEDVTTELVTVREQRSAYKTCPLCGRTL